MAIESSNMISHIFSRNFEQRDTLISHMRNAGLLVGEGVTNPLLRADLSKIQFKPTEDVAQQARDVELIRVLRRVQMLQSISGGYEKSQDIDRVTVERDV